MDKSKLFDFFQTIKGDGNIAKDGTHRGGARPGAGRKPKPLAEKIETGNPGGRKLKKLDIPDFPEPAPMEGVDIPEPNTYLSAIQRDGTVLCAADIYTKTCLWLSKLGCEKLVNPQLLEQYAMCTARWIQCEEAVSRLGFLGRHATTSQPTQSPFVAMSQSYMKQANQLWFQIFGIVRENCTVDVTGPDPMDDAMERLLRARNG